MPTDLSEVDTQGVNLVFSDNLEGTEFRLKEPAVYEAEEVRDQTGQDIPEFGDWLPVETDREENTWLVALGELVGELQDLANPVGVELVITRCEKSGPKQTDPYEINVEVLDGDEKQAGLNTGP